MKILKKILIIVVVIILIPFVVALFVKKQYSIEKEIIINKSKQEVFDYVKFLKNQDNYSKWATMDAEMKTTYRGNDGTVGFVSAWESDKEDVGVGEQEITAIIEGERIDYELRFIKPFQSTSLAYMITETLSENQTIVKWGFHGNMNYPMNLMLLFVKFEEMIGRDLQEGLDKLKILLED